MTTLDEVRELWRTSKEWQPVIEAVNELSVEDRGYFIRALEERGWRVFLDHSRDRVFGWERSWAPDEWEALRPVGEAPIDDRSPNTERPHDSLTQGEVG